MILGFTKEINGKPTFFVEKIWESILQKGIQFKAVEMKIGMEALPKNYLVKTHLPKLHTIREDKTNRCKVGSNIDFFINVRQPNMFRFAPVLPVVSTQEIEIIWKDNLENFTCLGMSYDKTCTIMVDNRFFGDVLFLKGAVVSASDNLLAFAQNDGFDTLKDFFDFFNQNFKGKIIHWTEKKY